MREKDLDFEMGLVFEDKIFESLVYKERKRR